MNPLVEGNLQIALPTSITGRKFDDEATHRLSHCMKRVDFIVELPDRVLFIEVKDPDNPKAKANAANRDDFVSGLQAGQIDEKLKTKFRDTWLYEWAEGRSNKPITYLVLIGASTLSDAELLVRTDSLKRQVPLTGPGDRPWKRPIVAACAVMNVAAWNKALPQFPVSRLGP